MKTEDTSESDEHYMDKGFRRKLRAEYRQLATNIEGY